jgi:O-antigen/teichoic acid export membrane protein
MLAKYGAIQLASRFLPGCIGFFVAASLTRLLEPEQYGLYGLASGMAQIVALSAFGWVGLSLTRLAAGRTFDSRLAGSTLAIFGAVAAAVVVASGLALLLPLGPANSHLVAATAFGCIALAYFDLKSSAYTASFEFLRLLALNLARALAAGVATIVAARFFGNGLGAFLASSAAVLVVCLLWRRRSGPAGLAVDAATVKRIAAFGLPLAVSLSLFAAVGWGDRLVLNAESGVAAVGFYSAAAVLIQNTLQFASQAIGSAAYPLAVRAYENGEPRACDRQLEQNLVGLIGFLLPAATGMALLADNIGHVLVGQHYREAVVQLTPVLAATAVISGLRGNFVDHSFQLTGATWHCVAIAADMCFVDIAVLFLLVPRYGYMGAGLAGLVTAIVGLVHAIVASRRIYRLPFPAREIAKVLAAVFAMGLAIAPLASFTGAAALLIQTGSGCAVYVVAAFALNLLDVRHRSASLFMRWRAARYAR